MLDGGDRFHFKRSQRRRLETERQGIKQEATLLATI